MTTDNRVLKAKMQWTSDMEFQCFNRDHKITLDATAEHGGKNNGPSPKELLLDSMMGCTGMDVVAILNKMRQKIESFEMEISAVKTLELPVHFETAVLRFLINGPIEKDKAIKAVDLSLSKYCGVNFIVSKSCKITYELMLNGQTIKTAPVGF